MIRVLSLAAVLAIAGCSTSSPYGGRYGSRYPDARSYPASAKTSERGQDRYRLCHNGRQTLTLPTAAVRAHLNHGDSFGSCGSYRQDDRDRDDRRRGDRGRGRGRGRR